MRRDELRLNDKGRGNEVGDVRLRRNGFSVGEKKVCGSIWFVLFVTAAVDVCFNEESTI